MVFNENHQFLLKAGSVLAFKHKFYCFHCKAEALLKSVVKLVTAVIAASAMNHIDDFFIADNLFDKFKKIIHCASCFNAFIANKTVAIQKCVKAEFVVIHKKLPFNNLDKKVFPMYNDFGRTFLSGSDNASCDFGWEQFALFLFAQKQMNTLPYSFTFCNVVFFAIFGELPFGFSVKPYTITYIFRIFCFGPACFG